MFATLWSVNKPITNKTYLFMDANIIEIFYLVYEFCKEFEKYKSGHRV
jgi:hypothetical protein